ncbi:PcfB family protein [Ruthenibacterium lactatiformans]|uniref:PcfB family protein n=1 Tax=Ruthenibacterium lactatiformans TaxID=1550024 RepID=UPI003AEF2213
MQEEVSTKIVAIAIRGGKISADVLDKALKKFVQELEKAQKTASQPKTYRGKQTVKHLVSQNAAISNIEVTDGNIKSFDRTAKKYGIDYALKKDTSELPPRYIVFFKGRDVDVMTQAFKEFSSKTVKRQEKPSLRQQLSKQIQKAKENKHREKEKVNTKERGVEL